MSLTRQRRRHAAPSAAATRPQPQVTVRSTRGDLAQRKPPARTAPERKRSAHWQQTGRWFWLSHPNTLERELVQSSGRVHVQGPHEMVEYTTQGGRITACTTSYFEDNTEPWVPGEDWR